MFAYHKQKIWIFWLYARAFSVQWHIIFDDNQCLLDRKPELTITCGLYCSIKWWFPISYKSPESFDLEATTGLSHKVMLHHMILDDSIWGLLSWFICFSSCVDSHADYLYPLLYDQTITTFIMSYDFLLCMSLICYSLASSIITPLCIAIYHMDTYHWTTHTLVYYTPLPLVTLCLHISCPLFKSWTCLWACTFIGSSLVVHSHCL